MTDIAEVWRDLPDSEYGVSNLGNVVSKRLGGWRILKPAKTSSGYLVVWRHHKPPRRTSRVHLLVAQMFLGEKPTPRHEINHKDGDKTNNRADNLEWVTHSENVKHSIHVLGNPSNGVGSLNSFAKLNEDSVRVILYRHAAGHSTKWIAKEFGVSESNVRLILNRQTWRHVYA